MLSQYQTSLNREHIKTILLVYSLSVLIGIGMKRQKTKAQSRVMPVTVKSTVSSMIKKKTLVRYLCTDQQLEMPFKSYFLPLYFSAYSRGYTLSFISLLK